MSSSGTHDTAATSSDADPVGLLAGHQPNPNPNPSHESGVGVSTQHGGVDPVTAYNNLRALNTKSYDIKFDLTHTDYEPIENIGSGAYGVVCSATHRKSGERVAIKKIPDIFDG